MKKNQPDQLKMNQDHPDLAEDKDDPHSLLSLREMNDKSQLIFLNVMLPNSFLLLYYIYLFFINFNLFANVFVKI